MAIHWPHHTQIQVKDREHLHMLLHWMNDQFGDVAYQHWTSEYKHPTLRIKFCDKMMKTQFDLTWC